MTNIIEHLEREQTREKRRELLANDAYVLFHDHLEQLNKEGKTALSQVEVFLSAENFAKLLLSLRNIQEGIKYELDDLEDDAEGENDAMIISVLAACLISAQRVSRPESDRKFAVLHILTRWDEHPLLDPMLQAAARKEEARWMEGKKTDLLTCELEEIERCGEGEAAVREVFEYFVGMSASVGENTIKENLLILNKYNNDHGHKYQPYIDALYEKLGIKTTTQFNYDKLFDVHDNNTVEIGK